MNPSHRKIGLAIGGVIAVILIIGLTTLFIPSTKVRYDTAQVKPMDLTQTVTATGNVTGNEEASLAFDTGGTVASVNVQVGDSVKKGQLLGALSSDILSANLESAQANTIAVQAQLAQLQQGNRPEAVAVYQQKVADAQSSFFSIIHDAYLKTQDALENKVDTLFTNGQSVAPEINIPTTNDSTRTTVDRERSTSEQKLIAMGNISTTSDITQAQTTANDTLTYVRNFLADLASVINNLAGTGSGYSQTTIATDRSIVNAAASEVTAALTEYVAAQASLSESTQALQLEQATGTPIDIQTQTAKLSAAQAQADIIQSQINHTMIRAPFDGVVTSVDLKAGEVAVPGKQAFGIMSNGLKIEIPISENDISKITASNTAAVTLDAYGSDVSFPAHITLIDPAETVVNGINSYKVTLQFDDNDARIRSGMTANVSIVTAQATQALAVPTQAIITEGSSHFVLVKDSQGNFIKQPVMLGVTDSNGYTAVTSGVTNGDTIASFGIK